MCFTFAVEDSTQPAYYTKIVKTKRRVEIRILADPLRVSEEDLLEEVLCVPCTVAGFRFAFADRRRPWIFYRRE